MTDAGDRVTRTTFSLPQEALERIDRLRKRLAALGLLINQSEVVRLGLIALMNSSDREITNMSQELKRLKAGRPPRQGEPRVETPPEK